MGWHFVPFAFICFVIYEFIIDIYDIGIKVTAFSNARYSE